MAGGSREMHPHVTQIPDHDHTIITCFWTCSKRTAVPHRLLLPPDPDLGPGCPSFEDHQHPLEAPTLPPRSPCFRCPPHGHPAVELSLARSDRARTWSRRSPTFFRPRMVMSSRPTQLTPTRQRHRERDTSTSHCAIQDNGACPTKPRTSTARAKK